MKPSGKRVMNLNSLLQGADNKTDKKKERPTSAFSKPVSMGALSSFEKKFDKEDSKIQVEKETTKQSPNKIMGGLSKLFEKADEMKIKEKQEESKLQVNPVASTLKSKRPSSAFWGGQKRSSGFGKTILKDDFINVSDNSASKSGSKSDKSNDVSESSKSSEESEQDEEDDDDNSGKDHINEISKTPLTSKRRNSNRKKHWFKNSASTEVEHDNNPKTTPTSTRRVLLIVKENEDGTHWDEIQPLSMTGTKSKSK